MMPAKVFAGRSIDDCARRRAEPLLEYVVSVRTSDGMHRVKQHAKAAFEKARVSAAKSNNCSITAV